MRSPELDAVVTELREAALEEVWSDAARAASAAARRSKAQGGNWRVAGRRAYGNKKPYAWRRAVKQMRVAAAGLVPFVGKREQKGLKRVQRLGRRFQGLTFAT